MIGADTAAVRNQRGGRIFRADERNDLLEDVALVLPGPLEESAQEERARIVRSAYEIAPILEQAWRSFARSEENLTPILPEIRCPVLIAWAKDDFVIPLKRTESAFQRFPNHRLEVFDGGHAAFLEDPDRFEHTLRDFLTETVVNRLRKPK